MKSLFLVVAGFLSLSAFAQKKNVSITHSINDDGKTLSITIKGTADGKPIDYSRTFDVSNMNKEERNALKERVYDSLGLPSPVAPVAPLAPHAPMAPRTSITLAAPATPAEPGPPVVSSRSQYSESYAIGGDHPYTKEIKYNPATGLLHMKYHFIKNGEEVTMEKSVDAKDKSREERNEMIKKYEREIGVAQPEII